MRLLLIDSNRQLPIVRSDQLPVIADTTWHLQVVPAWPAGNPDADVLVWHIAAPDLSPAAILAQLRPWLGQLPVCLILPAGWESKGWQLLREGILEFLLVDEVTPAALARMAARARHRFQGKGSDVAPAQMEQHLKLLNEITAASGLDSAAFLKTIVELLGQTQRATACLVTIWDAGRDRIELAAQYPEGSATSDLFIVGAESFTGRLLQKQQARTIVDAHDLPELTLTTADWWRDQYCLGLPLLVGQQPLGGLLLFYERQRQMAGDERRYLKQIASQVALALANARLFEEARRQLEELYVLNAVARAGSELLDENELLEKVTAIIGDTIYPDNFGILLLDEETGLLQAHPSYRLTEPQGTLPLVPLGEGVSGQVVATGEPVRLADVSEFSDYWQVDPATRSELCVPIKTGDSIIGVINAESRRLDVFTEMDERLMTTLAGQLAAAMQRIRLFTSTQRRSRDLAALVELSTLLRPANSVDEVLKIVMSQTLTLIGADKCRVCLVDPESGIMSTRGKYPAEPNDPLLNLVETWEGISGHVVRTGEVYFTPNLHEDPIVIITEIERPVAVNLRSVLALPLRAQEWICGVMHIAFESDYYFSQEEISLLTAVAEIAGNAIDRAMARENLEKRVAQRTQELAALNEQLTELDRLKSRFISDVSHELRTPVTSLRLYLDLLNRGQPDKREQYMEVIKQQTERLAHLVEGILSLSRIDLGQSPRQVYDVNLNQLIRDVVAANEVNAIATGLTLSFDPGKIPPLAGDGKQLHQIINNLVANALNYTQAGFVHVSTTFDEDANCVCLDVADSGGGIAEEDMPHIFERFYRGAHASQSAIPGHGLGLAIVYELVRLHNGRISVVSEPGEGTVFHVELPAPLHPTEESLAAPRRRR